MKSKKKKGFFGRLFRKIKRKVERWVRELNFWLMILGVVIVIQLAQTGLMIWFIRLIYHFVASLVFNVSAGVIPKA